MPGLAPVPFVRVSCGFVGGQKKRGKTGANPGYGDRTAVDRPMERRSADPIRPVQRGATGQTRHVVGRQPHGFPTDPADGLAAAADAGQRHHLGGVLPQSERSRRQWWPDKPGIRVADRQLPHPRGEHSAGSSRLTPRLLRSTTQTGTGCPRRPPTDLRHRVGLRRAHRQLLPPRPVGPLHFRLRTPQGTDPRRIVGGADQSAYHADRECPPASAAAGDRHPASPASRPASRSTARSGSWQSSCIRPFAGACRAG